MMKRLLLCLAIGLLCNPAFAQSAKAQKLFKKGEKAMEKRQYVGASVQFTKALAYHPEYAEAQYQRAVCFRAIGQINQAIKDFRQTLETDESFLMAYVQLIPLLREQKECDISISYCDQLAKALPEQKGAAHYHKALCYEQTKDTKRAISSLKVAMIEFEAAGSDFAALLEDCKAKLAAWERL
ncbi:MAG: tetratricopeptide repeat protein [Saprospiraceae bacterium]|nr:tetratricopeptide repeat protein [Saprospiraceae bacterium]